MSNEEVKKVSSEELSDWLNRDRNKQEMVAERLLVSPRTIDGWRNNRTIPDQYHVPLRKMMTGEDTILLSLSPELRAKLVIRAKEKGYRNLEAFVTEFIKGFIAVAVLSVISYQSLAPGDNNLLRGFRKREDITSIDFEVGEA